MRQSTTVATVIIRTMKIVALSMLAGTETMKIVTAILVTGTTAHQGPVEKIATTIADVAPHLNHSPQPLCRVDDPATLGVMILIDALQGSHISLKKMSDRDSIITMTFTTFTNNGTITATMDRNTHHPETSLMIVDNGEAEVAVEAAHQVLDMVKTALNDRGVAITMVCPNEYPKLIPHCHSVKLSNNQLPSTVEKGFCMRGDLCPYDHGEDRIVVDDIQRAAFEMMPGGPAPPFSMASNVAPFFAGGSNGNHMSNAEMFEMNMAAHGTDAMGMGGRLGSDNFVQGGMDGRSGHDMSARGGMRGRGSMRGIRGGRGRGGSSHPYNSAGRFGAGGTGGAATKTSLVVEHIPDEFNTIFKVNEFFTQFGSLVNIQLDQPAHKALIQYSTRDEANAAYNSPEVIFGNRFVKVYWQPDDQQGCFGGSTPKPTGQVQPTRPDHQGLASHHAVPKPPATSVLMTPERAAELAAERAAAAAKLEENKKVMMEIQKQKEALIQRQQEEQKLLLQKMFANKTMSQQDKDEILKGLKNVAIEVTKETPNPLAHAQAQAAAAEAQKQADLQKEVERLEKEQMDRELEVLGQTPSASGETSSASGASDKNAEATAALRAKLAALKAQALALGLTEGGGYAGRGRGAAYVPRGRGRGAMNPWARGGGRGGGPIVSQHRTFKLDNRSSKVSVQNVDNVSRAGLKAHFEVRLFWHDTLGNVNL